MQEQEADKREKFEKELRTLDGWAAAAAGDGEICGFLCGDAANGHMTLADIAYFPFLERIEATLEPIKVGQSALTLGSGSRLGRLCVRWYVWELKPFPLGFSEGIKQKKTSTNSGSVYCRVRYVGESSRLSAEFIF